MLYGAPLHHHKLGERSPLLGSKLRLEPRAIREPTPLPLTQLSLLLLCRLVEPIAFCSVFSFVNQDVASDQALHLKPSQVGLYSGCVESAFAGAQALTVLGYGRLSDRIGRRPVILIGLAGTGVSVVCFGLAKTFRVMVFARCLSGLLNGNSAVIRTSMSEITDESNEAYAFSLLAATWPLGVTLGPWLGGVLADPVRHYPALFRDSLIFKMYPYLLSCAATSAFAFIGFLFGVCLLKETRQKRLDATCRVDDNEPPPPMTSILTSDVCKVLWHSSCLGFLGTALDAILPLVLYTPRALGGQDASESAIGRTLASRAVLAVFCQLCLFPALQKRCGNAKSAQILTLSFLLPIGFLSLSTVASMRGLVASSYTLFGLAMLSLSFACTAHTSSFLLLNHACPSRAALGSVNGVAQTLSAISRAFAPVAASGIYALSIEKNVAGGHFIFVLLAGVALLGTVCTLRLRDIDQPQDKAQVLND